MFQLLKALRGRSTAVVFPDGNSGASEDDGGYSVPLSFLGQPIKARTGAAVLAYAAGVPIVPVIPFKARRRSVLRFFSPISPLPSETIRAFSVRATKELFEILEAAVRRSPAKWEEWHVLYHWIRRKPADARRTTSVGGEISDLIRMRLVLANESLWWVRFGGHQHAVDVRSWMSLGTDPNLGRLISHAEAKTPVSKWLEGVQDHRRVLALLKNLLDLGYVAVC